MQNILDFFVSAAYADAPQAAPQGGGMSFLMMFAVFFFFIYFAIWRPQNKRMREQRQLLDSLAKGDEVMTQAGIVGRIHKLTDQFIVLALNDEVEVVMQKSAIANVLPKGTIKSIE